MDKDFPYTCLLCGGAYNRCAYNEFYGEKKCKNDHKLCFEYDVCFTLDEKKYIGFYSGKGYALMSFDKYSKDKFAIFPEEFRHIGEKLCPKNLSVKDIYFVKDFTCKSCRERYDIKYEMKRYENDIIDSFNNGKMTWGLWADLDLYYPTDDENYIESDDDENGEDFNSDESDDDILLEIEALKLN